MINPQWSVVDLDPVTWRAVGEFIAAYQAQIKRTDYSDRARLDTLRLTILNIALSASDWTSPIQKVLADIVRFPQAAQNGPVQPK